jgi:predicted permease
MIPSRIFVMSGLLYDLRFAGRALRRSPGMAAAAVLMLALGIGSATAIFSIVNSVLLRPLPWRDSERIMTLWERDENGRRMDASLLNYRDWRSQAGSFEAMAALGGFPSTISGGGRTERGYVASFHGDPLEVLGLRVAAGRVFTDAEKETGSPPVAVISSGLAKRLWIEPVHAVGETLNVAGISLTVAGVIEPSQDERTDVYAPAAIGGPDRSSRSAHNWQVMGRLRTGVSVDEARAEMQTIGERIRREHAGETNAANIEVTPLLEITVQRVRSVLLTLLAAGGLLILIACANVANLLLAQGVSRRREISIRHALGAGRWRIARQMLFESVMLALLAGAAGTLLAHWSFEGLLSLIPGNLPRRAEISMDTVALGFSLLASLTAGVLFGLAPVLRTPKALAGSLKEQSRSAAGGDSLLRDAFVIAEYALALAMLTCTGLVAKSFMRLMQVDPGFRQENVLLAETELPGASYRTDEELNLFWQRLLERLASLPDIEHAGLANMAPLEGTFANGHFEFSDNPGATGYAWYGVATAGYFRALQVPLVRGRLFEETDSLPAPQVAVVNETAARKFWPNEEAIGKRIRWAGMDRYDPHVVTIVGVVGDVRHSSLKQEPDPEIYMHFFQRPSRSRDADLVVRARTDVARLPNLLREEFRSADAALPVRFQSMASVVDAAVAQPWFQVMLFGFFASCAILLSAVGLFSAMAYAVRRQTRELGIRLALGATPESVRRFVLRRGLRITLAGIVGGALLAFAGGRLISASLFGVQATDAGVFVGAALLLTVSALLACYLPARRASRIDPMAALRYE